MIITVSCQKGGVGKSFTASLLLEYLHQSGVPSAGLDLDPQQCIHQRYTSTAERGNLHIPMLGDMVEAVNASDEGQVIIVDTAPANYKLEEIYRVSDMVVVPMAPNVASLLGCQRVRAICANQDVMTKTYVNQYKDTEMARMTLQYMQMYHRGQRIYTLPTILQLEKTLTTPNCRLSYNLRQTQINAVNDVLSYLLGYPADITTSQEVKNR